MRWRAMFACSLWLVATGPAWAVQPDEMLRDSVLEARARGLSRELRCMVCQNESIDDSNADLARDLRVLVRERLSAGDTDQAVLQFLTARYGDFVLLRPRFNAGTFVLWVGPFAVVLIGAAAMWAFRRRQSVAPAKALSDEEEARVKELMGG